MIAYADRIMQIMQSFIAAKIDQLDQTMLDSELTSLLSSKCHHKQFLLSKIMFIYNS